MQWKERTALDRWEEIKDLPDEAPGYSPGYLPALREEIRFERKKEIEGVFREIFSMHISMGLSVAEALERTEKYMDGTENFHNTMNRIINQLIEKEMGT